MLYFLKFLTICVTVTPTPRDAIASKNVKVRHTFLGKNTSIFISCYIFTGNGNNNKGLNLLFSEFNNSYYMQAECIKILLPSFDKPLPHTNNNASFGEMCVVIHIGSTGW